MTAAAVLGKRFYNRFDMSLTTRCPTCTTTFKVVPDQLRISDGWVRCGRCGEVFDASANVREAAESDRETDGDTAAALTADSAEMAMPLALAEPLVQTRSMQTEVEDTPHEPPLPVTLSDALTGPAGVTMMDKQWWSKQPSLDIPVPVPVSVQLSIEVAPHAGVRDARAESIPAIEGAAEAAAAPVMTHITLRASDLDGVAEEPAQSAPVFLPGFLRAGVPRTSAPPKARRWLVALAVVGFSALPLQIVFHERDFLAARHPKLKPMLTSVCRLAGCEVHALRQIASITVDGASFSRDSAGDGYRLYFSLRNVAAIALKMPAIELTLLDSQERSVVRRVLLPSDFGAPPVLPPYAERTASLLLTLTGREAAALPSLAGYHIDPFYP